ncbi:NAD-dependent epimerase/dehydratase family protein [Clostridium butyricum]|uniref:NAD-dependent epimerase/dehydratase family protein n=1 Tax=Clostridium butyricum TaxID=1492 RepID=UPI00374F9A82
MKSLSGKVVVITGATGLIGSHLVDELLNENAKVIAIGRNEEKIRAAFKQKLDNENFSYLVCDIADGVSEQLGVVDLIFHAASPISGEDIKSKPVNVIDANLVGTRNCLEYLKKQKEKSKINGRMIVFSSATVYGNNEQRDNMVSEVDTYIADSLNSDNSPYSESKRMIEVIAHAYNKQYGVDSVIARIGYVYGFSKNKPNTAFYEFIGKAISGENIVLNNSGMSRRDNIYVSDVVSALIFLSTKGKTGEAYNISSSGEKDNFKAIDEIAEIIANSVNELNGNNNIKVVVKQNDGDRKPGIILNNNKLKALGWSIDKSIYNGVKETIKNYIG